MVGANVKREKDSPFSIRGDTNIIVAPKMFGTHSNTFPVEPWPKVINFYEL